MLVWLVYAIVGKIIIFTWMKFPLPEKLEKNNTVSKLHICDFCSGAWIYAGLAFFIHANLVQQLFGVSYIPLVEQMVTGIITSFLVHIFSLGWKAKFEVVII